MRPDALLVCVRSAIHGRILFGETWRSAGVKIIAASAYRGQQESLLLMPLGGLIHTETGKWVCDGEGKKWEMVAC